MRTTGLLLSITLAGCVGEISNTGDDEPGTGSGSNEPVVCETTRSYAGFGGALESDRPQIEPGSDRVRLKPYGALAIEYARALGLANFNTAQYAATFGRAPARWYNEPQASANTVYASFSLAYAACREKTATGGDFATAPSQQIAERLCRDFARAAWSRDATDAEATACVTYTLEKTNPADPPAKRWAYACASVLTASGFLAY